MGCWPRRTVKNQQVMYNSDGSIFMAPLNHSRSAYSTCANVMAYRRDYWQKISFGCNRNDPFLIQEWSCNLNLNRLSETVFVFEIFIQKYLWLSALDVNELLLKPTTMHDLEQTRTRSKSTKHSCNDQYGVHTLIQPGKRMPQMFTDECSAVRNETKDIGFKRY